MAQLLVRVGEIASGMGYLSRELILPICSRQYARRIKRDGSPPVALNACSPGGSRFREDTLGLLLQTKRYSTKDSRPHVTQVGYEVVIEGSWVAVPKSVFLNE